MTSRLIIKRKEEAVHGEYRTKRVILETFDEMARAIQTGQPCPTNWSAYAHPLKAGQPAGGNR